MSKEEILYIGNALMWFVIGYTPIILYTLYYTRNLNQNKEELTREDINKQAYLVMSNINAVRITTDIKDKHHETLMNSFMTLQGMFNEYLKP